MDRRREIQRRFNREHGITPRSIVKSMEEVRLSTHVADARTEKPEPRLAMQERVDLHDPAKRAAMIQALERQMRQAAANLEFELAAMLRDQVNDLRAVSAPDVHRGATARVRRQA
jgi:excinuclease ABC subunit B